MRCCRRLGASLCSARPPRCVSPASAAGPPVPSPAFPFLTPLKFTENVLKIEFNFCAGKGTPSRHCVEGGLAQKLSHLEVYLKSKVGGCTCALWQMLGHERCGGWQRLEVRWVHCSPRRAPLHGDLRQRPEARQGSCQLSPPYDSTNHSNALNFFQRIPEGQRALCCTRSPHRA